MFENILVPCLIFLVTQSSASRILVVIPSTSYSHQFALRPLWKELSLKGHQVILATTDPAKDPALVNLTEIDMHDTYPLMTEWYALMHTRNPFSVVNALHETIDDILEFQLSKYIQHLIKNESMFDVIIVESMMPEYLALADFYKCPSILISSFEVTSLVYGYLGNPTNPIAYPDMVLPFAGEKLRFAERVVSFLYNHLYYAYKVMISYPRRRKVMVKHFGEDVRSIEELYHDINLLLVNVHPIINNVKPLGPNSVTFGGANHILPPKQLPKDLQDFLDNAKEGCIFFSLGTNSKSMYMDKEKIQIIMEALSELPYKILWKFEIEDMLTPPKNIKFISWVSQQDVLRHPNIKLFITQGGVQSLEEAIVNHVPMVTMPMYGDQEANAQRMAMRGISKTLPHKPLPKKDEFKEIVLEVINDPKYKENVIKVAEVLLDNPMSGIEKAVWWIEYVIRHKGAKHLRSPAIDIPFYQFYSLDVIATLLAIVYVTFKLVSYIFCLVKRLICRTVSIMSDRKEKRE